MRVGLVADPHLGNHKRFGGPVEVGLNRRCREALQAFRGAVAVAHVEGCEVFVVLGDLFDTTRPEPQLIAAVQDAFYPHIQNYSSLSPDADDHSMMFDQDHSMMFYLLLGNHEMTSTALGDHALGPLDTVGVCGIDRAYQADLLYLVPFAPGDAAVHTASALRELDVNSRRGVPRRKPPLAVCLHAGVRDARTAPWLRGAPDSIDVHELASLCAGVGVGYAFAGNWHDRRSWTRIVGAEGDPPRDAACSAERLGGKVVRIHQLGALVPTGWDNPGPGYGALAIFDTDLAVTEPERAVRFIEVPGPRFFTLRGYEALEDWGREELEAYVSRGYRPYFRVLVPAAEFAETCRLFESSGMVGEVLPEEDPDAELRAREGAVEARAAETLEEALAAWVSSAELTPGVDRAEVLSLARGYLAGGARA